jgi:hypothetical protein
MKKKITFSVIIFLIFFTLGTAFKVRAGVSQSARGWLWGGSEDSQMGGKIGGLNCTQSTDSQKCIDDNETMVDIIAMNGADSRTLSLNDFGVNIPNAGSLTGYAYSNKVGWIDFGLNNCVQTSLYGACSAPPGKYCAVSCVPDAGTNCGAGVVRNGNNLQGCARIVGIAQETVRDNSGGWQGWIRMENVQINPAEGTLSGYGWNGENNDNPAVVSNRANGLGFFDFKDVTVNTLTICENSCNSGIILSNKTISMGTSSTKNNIKACFSQKTDCSSSNPLEDITKQIWDTSPNGWSINSSPSGILTQSILGGNNYSIASGLSGGTATVTAKYGENTASFNVQVAGVCSDSCDANKANVCRKQFCQKCDGSMVEGTKDCTSWREIGSNN